MPRSCCWAPCATTSYPRTTLSAPCAPACGAAASLPTAGWPHWTPAPRRPEPSPNLRREVAYTRLSAARRRMWHRRVAAALASGPESVTVGSQVAFHYERAGLAADALAWYRQAAEAARAVYANAEAQKAFER